MEENKICGGDVIGNLFDRLGIRIHLNTSNGELYFEDIAGKYRFVWICPEHPNDNFSCTHFDKIIFAHVGAETSSGEILECLYQFILAEKCLKIEGMTRKNVPETIFTIPQFKDVYELKIKLDILGKED